MILLQRKKKRYSFKVHFAALKICSLKRKLNIVPEEERAHGTISNKTYYLYLREGAGSLLLLFFVCIFLLAEVSSGNGTCHYDY